MGFLDQAAGMALSLHHSMSKRISLLLARSLQFTPPYKQALVLTGHIRAIGAKTTNIVDRNDPIPLKGMDLESEILYSAIRESKKEWKRKKKSINHLATLQLFICRETQTRQGLKGGGVCSQKTRMCKCVLWSLSLVAPTESSAAPPLMHI